MAPSERRCCQIFVSGLIVCWPLLYTGGAGGARGTGGDGSNGGYLFWCFD